MTEFDANEALARRADASRTTGCYEPDDLAPARGIIVALPIGIAIWTIAIVAVIALWN